MMGKKLMALAAALILLSVTAGFSQSLAELAKKEKERRAKLKAETKTITDVEAAKYKGGAITTGTPAEPAATGAEAKPAGPAAEGTQAAGEKVADEPVDFQGRPESFWRQTMADARQQVTSLENEANVLSLRLADLQNKFYQEADGFKQQQIQREIQKTLYEQDQNKIALAKARQQLQDLETEARKSGALPGWLKSEKP
jgi:hypothetical protein